MSSTSGQGKKPRAADPLTKRVDGAVLVDKEAPWYLNCEECSSVAFNCNQTNCGFRICQQCVKKVLDEQARSNKCPCKSLDCDDYKKSKTTTTFTPDLSTRRDVNQLKVSCINSGCPHQCKWIDLESHLDESCQFEKTQCDLCQSDLLRHEMSDHKDLQSDRCCRLFVAPCPHCGTAEMLNRPEFLQHLRDSCPKRLEERALVPASTNVGTTDSAIDISSSANATASSQAEAQGAASNDKGGLSKDQIQMIEQHLRQVEKVVPFVSTLSTLFDHSFHSMVLMSEDPVQVLLSSLNHYQGSRNLAKLALLINGEKELANKIPNQSV